jgi:hypothetical protein
MWLAGLRWAHLLCVDGHSILSKCFKGRKPRTRARVCLALLLDMRLEAGIKPDEVSITRCWSAHACHQSAKRAQVLHHSLMLLDVMELLPGSPCPVMVTVW